MFFRLAPRPSPNELRHPLVHHVSPPGSHVSRLGNRPLTTPPMIAIYQDFSTRYLDLRPDLCRAPTLKKRSPLPGVCPLAPNSSQKPHLRQQKPPQEPAQAPSGASPGPPTRRSRRPPPAF